MALRLYDTRTRQVRPFVPVRSGHASVYVCGPTVQAAPHVGHVRSAVALDVLRRWLLAGGLDVTFVRNVTDIDDKILHDAAHAGIPWWALAERTTRSFNRAYDAVQVLPPTAEPRATGHLSQMVDLIATLVDAGAAYPSGGDVYFDVRSLPSYGELSGQSPDGLRSAVEDADADADDGPKRNPLDFALWKGAKPGEPSWPTPWGRGRPGWHIECSAMAVAYLGETFDIHAGGLDLVFPHHENELAQSTAARHGFARWWLHHGLVNTGGEKMSKSLGNSLVVEDVLESVRPQVLRYYLGSPHYRSSLDYSLAGLEEAASAYRRLENFVSNAVEALGDVSGAEAAALEGSGSSVPGGDGPAQAWRDFAEALDDDLAVPRALAVVHRAARAGNAVLTDAQAGADKGVLALWLDAVRRMLAVLALDPVSQWPGTGSDARLGPVVDALVEVVLQARTDARSRRDYAAADAIRDRLAGAGVIVEDVADGVRWRLQKGTR